MFVAKDSRKKILKKRQNAFFSEILPGVIAEAKRLELTVEEIVDCIKNSEGRKS